MRPFDAFANSEGDHPKVIQNTNSFFIFTPAFSDNAETAIRYLNWMIDPENLMVIHNGFQGVHYRDLIDGIPQNFVPTDQLATNEIFNKYDIGIISQPPQFGDPVTNPKGWATNSLIDLCDSSMGISYGVVQRGDEFPDGTP